MVLPARVRPRSWIGCRAGMGRRVRLGRGGLHGGDPRMRGVCVRFPTGARARNRHCAHSAQAGACRALRRTCRAYPAGGVRERYFSNVHGVSCVNERLRALVEFRRHNLVRDPIPPAGEQPFDVILCRNVLIYFDRPTVEHILGALERALAPAGLLLLGAADRLSGQGLPVSRVVRPSGVGPRASRHMRHSIEPL